MNEWMKAFGISFNKKRKKNSWSKCGHRKGKEGKKTVKRRQNENEEKNMWNENCEINMRITASKYYNTIKTFKRETRNTRKKNFFCWQNNIFG